MKKRWFLLGAVLLLGLFIFRMCFHPKETSKTSHDEETTEQTSFYQTDDNEQSSSSVVRQAREALEQSQNSATDTSTKEVKEVLNQVMDYLKTASSLEMTYSNHLSITNSADAETIAMMIRAGYQYDETSVEVYKSDSSNVYQFLALFKKDEEVLSFTGNYVVGTQQVELAGLQGEPTGIAN